MQHGSETFKPRPRAAGLRADTRGIIQNKRGSKLINAASRQLAVSIIVRFCSVENKSTPGLFRWSAEILLMVQPGDHCSSSIWCCLCLAPS
jgi:cytochrome P450